MVGFSVLLPPTVPPRLASQAAAMEEAGVGGLWVADHLAGGGNFGGGPWWAAIPSLCAVLGATREATAGTLVASALLRPAATLALDAATLADEFPGRLRIGVGRGSGPDGSRVGRPIMAHPAEVVGYAADVADESGVPVVVAGNVEASVRAAAAAGGGWVTTGGFGRVGDEKVRRVRRLREVWGGAGGRGPTLVLVDAGEASPWRSADAMEGTLRMWASEGFNEVVVFRPDCYAEPQGVAAADAVRIAAGI